MHHNTGTYCGCVPALRVPLVHSLINHFTPKNSETEIYSSETDYYILCTDMTTVAACACGVSEKTLPLRCAYRYCHYASHHTLCPTYSNYKALPVSALYMALSKAAWLG